MRGGVFLLLFSCVVSLSQQLRIVDRPGETQERVFETESGPVKLIVGNKKGRSVGLFLPKPFEITSKPMSFTGGRRQRSGRKMPDVTIDEDRIILIEGVREPDDPNDTRVFRNARVINNVLVPDSQNIENQITQSKSADAFEGRQFYRREGRIMTGFADAETDAEKDLPKKENSGDDSSFQQFSAYRYNPDRSGSGDEIQAKREAVNQQNRQKIVSYTLRGTAENAQHVAPKQNVLYGSSPAVNHAERPNLNPSPSIGSPGGYYFPQNQQLVAVPNTNTPVNNPLAASNYYQQVERKSSQQRGPTSPVKFPANTAVNNNIQRIQSQLSSNVHSNPITQTHIVRQPNPFGQSFNTGIQVQAPSNTWVRPSTQRHPQQPHLQANSQVQRFPPLNQPAPLSNQIRRTHQQHRPQVQPNNIPTPHQAFKQSGGVHPGLIPASPQNFVVEKQTFQSHPGAPVFSVPVPRPVSQVQHSQPNHQAHLQQYIPGQDPAYYPTNFPYREVDQRPLLQRVMDPIRRIGQRVKEAGQQFGNSLRVPERMDSISTGTSSADAIPLVGGALAVATIGALGAYAATKYNFDDFRKLLPTINARSSNKEISTTLLKLAEDLENENSDFLKDVVPSMKWLESSCSKKMFCSIVTATIKEEEELLKKRLAEEQKSADGSRKTSGRSLFTQDDAKNLRKNETRYFEDHINLLLDRFRGKSPKKSEVLKNEARKVSKAIKEESCEIFHCNSH